MKFCFPLWLQDGMVQQCATVVVNAAREACAEVFVMDAVPEGVRDVVGRMRAVLILWSWLYYNGNPEVPDEQYDAGFHLLQKYERRYPELCTTLSPTQRVGKVMQ